MIRVIHIVNPMFGLDFSGHTHYLFSLLSGWNEDQVSLDLIGTQIKPLNMNSGNRVYQLPNGILWSKPKKQNRWMRIRWSLELLLLLIKNRNNYEIVHFHSLSWGALVSPLLLHLFNKKVVFTMSLMGNDNPSYLKQQSRGRIQTSLLKKFDGGIGLSPALVTDALNNEIKNVICLPNFMPIHQLEEDLEPNILQKKKVAARKKLNINQDAQVLLFIGSIIARKGVDTLLEAFFLLTSKYPKLILILVGPMSSCETNAIEEQFVIQLQKKIDILGLSNRVIWTGMVKDQSDLVYYYRCSDIFILPTRNEGSPNVLAEAMASYLPVIISLLPGVTDTIISNDVNGLLVEKDNIQGFATAIEKLITNEKKCKAMGLFGRKKALEKFSFNLYCQKLKLFYIEILNNEKIQND